MKIFEILANLFLGAEKKKKKEAKIPPLIATTPLTRLQGSTHVSLRPMYFLKHPLSNLYLINSYIPAKSNWVGNKLWRRAFKHIAASAFTFMVI